MSSLCDYCLSEITPSLRSCLFYCEHHFCEQCLEELYTEKKFICPIRDCIIEANNCKAHKKQFEAYCVHEYQPLCADCILLHTNCEVRGIDHLDSQVSKVRNQEFTPKFGVLIELQKKYEEFCAMFDENRAKMKEIQKNGVEQERRVEELLKVKRNVDGANESKLGVIIEKGKMSLGERIGLLEYWNDSDRYGKEGVAAYEGLQKILELYQSLNSGSK